MALLCVSYPTTATDLHHVLIVPSVSFVWTQACVCRLRSHLTQLGLHGTGSSTDPDKFTVHFQVNELSLLGRLIHIVPDAGDSPGFPQAHMCLHPNYMTCSSTEI